MDAPTTTIVPLDMGAKFAHRFRCIKDVFSFEKTLDLCGADGEGAKHQRTVGYRLVPWHLYGALERA
jgi:hypothetical protein